MLRIITAIFAILTPAPVVRTRRYRPAERLGETFGPFLSGLSLHSEDVSLLWAAIRTVACVAFWAGLGALGVVGLAVVALTAPLWAVGALGYALLAPSIGRGVRMASEGWDLIVGDVIRWEMQAIRAAQVGLYWTSLCIGSLVAGMALACVLFLLLPLLPWIGALVIVGLVGWWLGRVVRDAVLLAGSLTVCVMLTGLCRIRPSLVGWACQIIDALPLERSARGLGLVRGG